VAALLAGTSPAAAQLEVTMYRSFYPPNLTLVNGLFRVDGAMLSTGDACEYHVRLVVIDSTGTRLINNEWDGRCPAPRDGVASAALETFQFAVLPARYTVEVTVEPKGRPDSRISTKAPLESLPVAALASDLILARRTGWVDSVADVQWTITRGQLGIAAASEVVVMDTAPMLAYYIEVYPPQGRSLDVRLTAVIRRPDGRQLAQLPLQQVESIQQARPLAGNVSLAGLVPGNYVLEARLELSDTVLVRTHAFRMEGRGFASPAPAAGGSAAGADNYFASLPDAELTRLFDAVIVTLKAQRDRDLYERLNPDGRRRFLEQYFGVPGPTPGGSGTNPLDVYLGRVEYVIRQFPGRSGEAGWRTDRGRIYLLRGEPQGKVVRPLPPAGTSPFEVWSFTNAPGYAYLFVDEAKIGSFRLLWSNDPNESSLPDWDRRVGPEAVEEMLRMGIRISRGSGGSS
jgi:GWxTD domain-containing protein